MNFEAIKGYNTQKPMKYFSVALFIISCHLVWTVDQKSSVCHCLLTHTFSLILRYQHTNSLNIVHTLFRSCPQMIRFMIYKNESLSLRLCSGCWNDRGLLKATACTQKAAGDNCSPVLLQQTVPGTTADISPSQMAPSVWSQFQRRRKKPENCGILVKTGQKDFNFCQQI